MVFLTLPWWQLVIRWLLYKPVGHLIFRVHILHNTLRPRQNGRHFADDTFIRIFLNENVRIMIEISLKFVPKGLINNIPALVQIMAWRRSGDKPLSEPMRLVSLLTHICVARPQWDNSAGVCKLGGGGGGGGGAFDENLSVKIAKHVRIWFSNRES